MTNEFHSHAPLEGYVFLSSPDDRAVFLVERDGLVWKQHDQLVFYLNRQERPELLNWKTLLPGAVRWCFPEPGVPVLELRGAEKALRFLVSHERLWISDGVHPFDVESREAVTADAFEAKVAALRREWRLRLQWLDAIRTPKLPNLPCLHDAMRTAAMFQECAYTGLHPHYGAGFYGLAQHDGFPPTTLSTVSTRLIAGDREKAEAYFRYYLTHFVDSETGKLDYYGPSLAEYGMLLTLFVRFAGSAFFHEYRDYAEALARYLTSAPLDPASGLYVGSPEADEAADIGIFSHNNAQAAAGLIAFGTACHSPRWLKAGKTLWTRLRQSLDAARQRFGVVPYRLDGDFKLPVYFRDTRKGSYANYRYYPELLASGFLTQEEAREVVALRRRLGGDDCGVTTMRNGPASGAAGGYHYDNWTISTYALGLRHYGMEELFRETLAGHLALHTCPDIGIAYEQVTAFGAPRVPYADFCVPSQLTVIRLAAASVHSGMNSF